MRNAKCGMRNCGAEFEPGIRPVKPMLADPFRIPHSALRIHCLILAEHTLGGRAESTSPPVHLSTLWRGGTKGEGPGSPLTAHQSPLPLLWHTFCANCAARRT